MRVAFDSRPAGQPSGIGRYAAALLAELRTRLEVIEGYRPRRVDLYHAPWLQGALLRTPCPMVVTLHSLIDLKRPAERLRAATGLKLRYLAVQRAARVIVPNQAVACDVADHLGVEPSRIAVIPEAPARQFGRRSDAEVAALRSRLGLPERYLLLVGDLRRPRLQRQLARLAAVPRRLPLVVAGPPSRCVRELPKVVFAGRLREEELAALYTGAQALLLPAEDETSSLVGAEALSCATPVVACDLPAIRAALGNRATFVPPEAFEELVAAAEAGPQPPPATSRTWTWREAAEATLAVYQEAIEDAAHGRFPVVGGCPPPAVAPPSFSTVHPL